MRLGIGLGLGFPRFAGGGAPAPTPAPSFSTQPSIGHDGTPTAGEQMTGNDGTITNGTVSARAWLLAGTPVSGATGQTFTPESAGSYTYRVTATGPGGTTQANSAAVAVGAAPTPAALSKLVTMGDSNTFTTDINLPSYARAAPPFIGLVMGTTSLIEFNGVDNAAGLAAAVSRGMGTSADPADVNNNSIWSQRAAVVAAEPDTVTLLIGANDLRYANTGSNATERATDYVFNRVFAFFAWLRANGLPNVRRVVGLIQPAGAPWENYDFHNTHRDIANPLLRAAVGNQIDAIIPFGEHPFYGTEASTGTRAFFGDGIHYASGSRAEMRRQFVAVLKPIADRVTAGSQPAQFAYRDQYNVAPSTEVIEHILVTGLAMGATATASITGAGTMARGIGAFGTTPLTVMNGDAIPAKLVSAAGGDTPVTTTVTIGNKSYPFTVRTAPATMVQFTSGATRAFNNHAPLTCAFPAGRPIIALTREFDAGGTGTLLIDGVAATRVGRIPVSGSSNTSVTIFVGPPSQVLTAGNYTVTPSGTYGKVYGYPAALTNSASAATGWSFTKLDNKFRTANGITDWEAEGELLCPSGALRIVFALAQTNTNMVDGAEDRNFPNNGDELSYQQAWWFTSRKSDIPTIRFNLDGGNFGGFIAVSAQL